MAPNFGPIKDPGPVPPLLRPGKAMTPPKGDDREASADNDQSASRDDEGASAPAPTAAPDAACEPPMEDADERTGGIDGDQPAAPIAAGEQESGNAPVRIEATYRQAPRYGRFIFTGLLIGAIISFVLAIVSRGWSGLTMANTFWLSLIGLGALGMFIGAGIALYVDRKSLAAMQRQQKER